MWLSRFAVLLIVLGSYAVEQHSLAAARGVPAYGSDLAGEPITTLGPVSGRAIVLFFVASDCPISNRYFPEMARLRREFSPQGVAFPYVYPNLTETPASIRAHEATYAPHAAGLETLTDPRQEQRG